MRYEEKLRHGKIFKATKIIPLTIAVDHRAVDFNDTVPFMRRMDELLKDRAQIKGLM